MSSSATPPDNQGSTHKRARGHPKWWSLGGIFLGALGTPPETEVTDPETPLSPHPTPHAGLSRGLGELPTWERLHGDGRRELRGLPEMGAPHRSAEQTTVSPLHRWDHLNNQGALADIPVCPDTRGQWTCRKSSR